jgi:uncharacterized protein YdiU (UPF0061 family)
MNRVNPKFTLKNFMLEEAIKAAESDDFSKVNKLLELSQDPFNDELVTEEYIRTVP